MKKLLARERKKRLRVKLGEMKEEKGLLHDFLASKLSGSVTSKGSEISVDSRTISAIKLKKLVNKFIYHRNLMSKYWVGLSKDEIRINRFRRRKENKESKKGTPPSIIKHGF